MDDELKAIRNNIAKLSDDELERMVTVDSQEYRREAIEFAQRELKARGISIAPPAAQAGRRARTDEEAEQPARPGNDESSVPTLPCPICNGPVRRAALIGDNEIIAVFRDNEERRYVDVFACTRCGVARLVVDLAAIVEEE